MQWWRARATVLGSVGVKHHRTYGLVRATSPLEAAVDQRQAAPSACLVAPQQPACRGQGRPPGRPRRDRSEAEALDADLEPAATCPGRPIGLVLQGPLAHQSSTAPTSVPEDPQFGSGSWDP